MSLFKPSCSSVKLTFSNGCSWVLETSVKLIRGTATNNLIKCFLVVPYISNTLKSSNKTEMRSSRQGAVGSWEDQEVIVVVSEIERRWKCIGKDWARRLRVGAEGRGKWDKGAERWGKRLKLLRKGKQKSERLLVWEGGCVRGSQHGTVN